MRRIVGTTAIHRFASRPKRSRFLWLRVGFASLLFALPSFVAAQGVDTLWVEDWEGDWEQDWHDDFGTWQVGPPTSGPDMAYSGSKAAATILDGDYAEHASTKLIRHASFVVPDSSENPRLRFWHFFSISSNDQGRVQISTDGGATWETISETYTRHTSNLWTRAFVDLSSYAGQSVQIAFFFTSTTSTFCNPCVSDGWYIDDVMVVTGPRTYLDPEGWEGGIGDWYSDLGMWEVGAPTSGPQGAHSGSNVAATVLDGNYFDNLDSRLISPPLTVPDAASSPRLRFWHFFSVSNDDVARVQIKHVGQSTWQNLSDAYTRHSSNLWTRAFVDLSDYGGAEVQIAFLFTSRTSTFCNPCVSAGWYVDDITIETGERRFDDPEGWEQGIGDWYSDFGMWEVGAPTTGPGGAHSGSNVAATVLDGNYFDNLSSRLISPPLEIPAANLTPRLRFWHFFSVSNDDAAQVQIKVGDQSWQTISALYTRHSSNLWTRAYVDLSAYAGQTAQLAFYFSTRTSTFCNPCTSSGWYIDDITIETGPRVLCNSTDWEEGIEDWYTDHGTWEVGIPTSGPDSAFSGVSVAGTVLNGNYFDNIISRLISPSFVVPGAVSSPNLRFRNWFAFSNDDFGFVQISAADGPWETILGPYTGSSNGWSFPFLDLGSYASQEVRLAFLFQSRTSTFCNPCVSRGWYVDDVQINGLANPCSVTPVFLSNFAARSVGLGVEISWDVDADEELLGFLLYRRPAHRDWSPVTSKPIAPTDRVYVDHAALPGRAVQYYMIVLMANGTQISSHHVNVTPGAPQELKLRSFPNPFNPQATIEYVLPTSSQVKLTVHDVHGRRVATLRDGLRHAGAHQATWAGRDDAGGAVPSGIYQFRLQTDQGTLTKKAVLVK